MAQNSQQENGGARAGAPSASRRRRNPLHSAYGSPRKVVFLRDFCTRPFGSSCTRCMKACPKGAIAFANASAAIDSQACTACGICAGVCDAFSLPGMSAEATRSRLRKIALGGKTAILTCSHIVPETLDVADNVVVLPCLAALAPEMWISSLAEGEKLAVAVSFDVCETCSRTKGQGLEAFSHAIELAEEATECEVAFTDDIPERREESLLASTLGAREPASRRETLESLKDQAADIASGTYRMRKNETLRDQREHELAGKAAELIGGTAGAPEANPYTESGTTREVMGPRQLLILQAAGASDAVACRVEVALSQTDAKRCTGALACAKACPTGARQPDPKTGQLRFSARLCIGCGLCEGACEQGAVSLRTAYAGELLPEPGAEDAQSAPCESPQAESGHLACPLPTDDAGCVDVVEKS